MGREPSAKKKTMLFHHLQNTVAPDVFNPRMIYDRQKLAYCRKQLTFSESGNASGTVRALWLAIRSLSISNQLDPVLHTS